eukprot:1152104-Amorphochlora_amoeboformis.AAC.1
MGRYFGLIVILIALLMLACVMGRYFGLIVILITLLMFTQANTKSASQLRLEQKTVHLTIGTDGQ